MAGSPVVLPNPLGQALAASSTQILNLAFKKRQLDLQERNIASEEHARQIAAAAEAISSLSKVAPFDTPLGNFKALWPAVQTLTGKDPSSDPALANVIIHPSSGQDKLAALSAGLLTGDASVYQAIGMDPNSDAGKILRQSTAVHLGTGATGKTVGELTLAEQLAQGKSQAFTYMWNTQYEEAKKGDPRAMMTIGNIGRTAAGIDPAVMFPDWQGKPVEYINQASGELSLRYMEWRRATAKDANDRMDAYAQSLTDKMEKSGYEIPKSLALNYLTVLQNGDNQELAKWASVSDERAKLVELGAVGKSTALGYANTALDGMGPAGDQLRVFMGIGGQLTTFLPKEKVDSVLESITKVAGELAKIAGVPSDFPALSGAWYKFGFGSKELSFTPQTQASAAQSERAAHGLTPAGTGGPQDTSKYGSINDAAMSIANGTMGVGDAIVKYKLDESDAADIKQLSEIYKQIYGAQNSTPNPPGGVM